jgi:transposase
MPRYIGLDLHSRYVHGCEWIPDAPAKHRERHFRFPTTPAGWAQLIPQLDSECLVALEVTGDAFEVCDRLAPHAGQLVLANPLELKRLGSGRHTDRVDAVRLAKMLALGAVPTVWVPPQPMREVRRLLAYRAKLVLTRQRFGHQAKTVLARHGHHVPHNTDVARWLTSEVVTALPAVDRLVLDSAVCQWTAIGAELGRIEAEIATRVVDIPAVSLLLTITGVGIVTAAALWAIVGTPERFAGPRKVTRYVGFDASIEQSGETHRHGRISKNGSPLLRTLLVEAANVLAHHDVGPLRQFYLRTKRRLGHQMVICSTAATFIYVM